jgi:hypothetical protein
MKVLVNISLVIYDSQYIDYTALNSKMTDELEESSHGLIRILSQHSPKRLQKPKNLREHSQLTFKTNIS